MNRKTRSAPGGWITGRIGQALRPIFENQPAIARRDLVGRVCIVRTGSVTSSFGQAEVIDAESASHLIQVRCHETNQLGQGSRALVVGVDQDGVFSVCPDVDGEHPLS